MFAIGFGIGCSWQRLQLDLVKAGDAVGLGPQRKFSDCGKRPVRRGEQRLAIEQDCKIIAVCFQAKRVPFICGDAKVGTLDLLATALDHAIKTDVVLHRIGTSDVIIIGVDQPYDDASRLVDRASDRLEANRRIDVLG